MTVGLDRPKKRSRPMDTSVTVKPRRPRARKNQRNHHCDHNSDRAKRSFGQLLLACRGPSELDMPRAYSCQPGKKAKGWLCEVELLALRGVVPRPAARTVREAVLLIRCT